MYPGTYPVYTLDLWMVPAHLPEYDSKQPGLVPGYCTTEYMHPSRKVTSATSHLSPKTIMGGLPDGRTEGSRYAEQEKHRRQPLNLLRQANKAKRRLALLEIGNREPNRE